MYMLPCCAARHDVTCGSTKRALSESVYELVRLWVDCFSLRFTDMNEIELQEGYDEVAI